MVGTAPFVGMEHIASGTGRRTGHEQIDLAALGGPKAVFRKGDIIYGKLRPLLNKVWVAEFDGLCSADQVVFKVAADFDASFVAHYLRSPTFLGYVAKNVNGELPRIRLPVFLSLPVPVISLFDQRRVTEHLSFEFAAVETLVGQWAIERELTDGLRARAYDDSFDGILPLTAGHPDGEPPNGWSWDLLTDLARLESGHTPSRNHPEWWGGDVPWIQLADIRAIDGRVVSDTRETTNAAGIANSSARILPADTVVMSRTASVGFVTRMGRPMATSQDFVAWVCGPRLDPEFLMHALIRSRDYVRSLSSGAIHKTVYVPTVKSFRLCIPELTVQKRIVSALRNQLAALDRSLAAIDAGSSAVNALPSAILREAFAQIA